jgi:hypothetical protein
MYICERCNVECAQASERIGAPFRRDGGAIKQQVLLAPRLPPASQWKEEAWERRPLRRQPRAIAGRTCSSQLLHFSTCAPARAQKTHHSAAKRRVAVRTRCILCRSVPKWPLVMLQNYISGCYTEVTRQIDKSASQSSFCFAPEVCCLLTQKSCFELWTNFLC